MPYQDKNLRRALAIMASQPTDYGVRFGLKKVIVAEQVLSLDDDDDEEVLSILMANLEFGFAVTYLEETSTKLREMQRVWSDAADDLKKERA